MKKETEREIKDLIRMADFLDRHGNKKAADFVDGLIQKKMEQPEEVEIEVPEEELDLLRSVYEALGRSLK